jgi:hypothetical protein
MAEYSENLSSVGNISLFDKIIGLIIPKPID